MPVILMLLQDHELRLLGREKQCHLAIFLKKNTKHLNKKNLKDKTSYLTVL